MANNVQELANNILGRADEPFVRKSNTELKEKNLLDMQQVARDIIEFNLPRKKPEIDRL